MQPLVSIIIPCKSIASFELESVEGCLNLNWENLEILILPDSINTSVSWPSKVKIIETGHILPAEKRNMGIKNSNGKYIAFLDSDAYPEKNWLTNAIPLFSDPTIGVVGGPSFLPPGDDLCRTAGTIILSSKIGAGGLRSRYSSGKPTEVDDIPSSNMIVPKEIISEIGGFNANYWPGEDTYFCLQINKDLNKKILYSPNVIIYHHPRQVFKPHLKQMWGYGTHRGNFARRFPHNSRHVTYFIPSIFVLFNLIFGIASIVAPDIFLLPYLSILGIYFLICFVTSISTKNMTLFFLVILGIPMTHVTYGIAFMKGFFSNMKNN
ncbi:putative mycofactocin biosynthesis glycosyltransferase MftF protein [Marine Group I thaumarchaeote SCGC AAA799-B03]|uniref:Putative mycofactocin biosynthesis glycosyltransferase MftF protein n=1 Tax=Marine Group I thaumarchaeote SCGC AAA799-B03 TaxID=1502289 RepID=A0A087S903_9ARCH|nr:putative mycofactocin biosynthesis glycosyltransferase MftF protein [Marine Group I thaumarchaeote SCGC AAA799-B03]